MVWLAEPLLDAKAIGVCCCRPRVTLRPAESLVVVSQMLTLSLAACASVGGSAVNATAAASAPSAARGRILDMGGVLPYGWRGTLAATPGWVRAPIAAGMTQKNTH